MSQIQTSAALHKSQVSVVFENHLKENCPNHLSSDIFYLNFEQIFASNFIFISDALFWSSFFLRKNFVKKNWG